MKQFTSINDVISIPELLNSAQSLKQNPMLSGNLGRGKTLGLIFLNPSLRTRISTQKAALNLGLNTMVFNLNKEGWEIETRNGVVMNGTKVEHIKDAAHVMGMYCDLIGLRSFAGLTDKNSDYAEEVLNGFIRYSGVPVINLESALGHPLQSLADLLTIHEHSAMGNSPKIVLTWAPHVKPIPHAVANSFTQWILKANYNLHIACPIEYKLDPLFSHGATIHHQQEEAIKDADFIYVKNWCSFYQYGEMPAYKGDWLLNKNKINVSNNAKIMHCLPVRRNVEVRDEELDSMNSLVYKQAANRVWATQAVLKSILEDM